MSGPIQARSPWNRADLPISFLISIKSCGFSLTNMKQGDLSPAVTDSSDVSRFILGSVRDLSALRIRSRPVHNSGTVTDPMTPSAQPPEPSERSSPLGLVWNAAGILIAAVILFLFYEYVFTGSINPQHFDPTEATSATVPAGRLVASASAMLFGILFGSFYNLLRKKTKIVSWRAEVVDLLRSAQVFRALLAAPVIYSGVYLAARSQPDIVLSLIFAFQNGFFCDAIMRTQERRSRK
jgi:hypothetical protein